MQCKDQINTIITQPFNEWTACPFSPRLWKLKLMYWHSTVIDEARDAYPEPEKGHASQTRVSLEFLMFQWSCDCPLDRPCLVITNSLRSRECSSVMAGNLTGLSELHKEDVSHLYLQNHRPDSPFMSGKRDDRTPETGAWTASINILTSPCSELTISPYIFSTTNYSRCKKEKAFTNCKKRSSVKLPYMGKIKNGRKNPF